MIALTNVGTADKIDIVTTGATVSVDYSCTQSDKAVTETNPTSLTTKPKVGNIAGAGTTKITTDPASGHEAFIREISAVNVHATASCTVQAQQTINGGTAAKLSGTYTLAPGEKLLINADGTLYVYDATGGVKLSVAAALSTTILTSGAAATYTTPVGCRALWVRLVGGGGGAGGVPTGSSTASVSGGGGGGGYREALISAPTGTYTYTVGAGGNGGAAGANAGTAGSDTTFGSLTAKGGTNSVAGIAAGTTVLPAAGGAGGTVGSGGDFGSTGEPGTPGIRASGTAGMGGMGGSGFFGGGGAGATAAGVGGAAAANSGGGGGGSLSTSTAQAGGAGGSGVIVIHEFY